MLNSRHTRLVLLLSAAAVLIMLIITYVSQRQNRDRQSEFTVSQSELTWMSSSMLLEHHRLMQSMWLFAYAAGDVDRDDLVDRLDIYWSRFDALSTYFDRYYEPLVMQPQGGNQVDKYAEALGERIRILQKQGVATLSSLERRLNDFQPHDLAMYSELRNELNTLSDHVTQFLLAAFERSRNLNQFQIESTENINRRLRNAYLFIVFCIGMFALALTLYLWRKHRSAEIVRQSNARLLIEIDESTRLAQELERRATHDDLSGLLNRQGLNEHLDDLLTAGTGQHGLCFIDLDLFKIVNDTSGHAAGDALIQEVAHLLKERMPEAGIVARFGGDEFIVLIRDTDKASFERIIIGCCEAFEPFRFAFKGREFNITGSFGAVHFNATEYTQQSLLKIVDAACYEAKNTGGGRIHFHGDDDSIVEARRADTSWVHSIQLALNDDRFCLYYQPIHSLQDDAVHAVHSWELLVRMIDEDGQILAPHQFLDVAQRYSLAPRIDRWVVNQAFAWVNHNAHLLDSMDCLNINLSGLSVGDIDFLNYLELMTEELQVDTRAICFEITESAAVGPQAREFLTRLKELGYQLALDDFGTGFSSFGYLESLPVDYIKIDGLFVRDMDTNKTHQEFVKAISAVGKVMGKTIVAEFVGNEESRDMLRALGVDYAQGYHFARPTSLPDPHKAQGPRHGEARRLMPASVGD